MDEIFDQISRDCRSYREAVDQIFTADILEFHGWQRCLLSIQVGIAQLQLDRLHLIQKTAVLETISVKAVPQKLLSHDTKREMDLRNRLKGSLDSLPFWTRFKDRNPVAELSGLRSVHDYIQSFQLHLPEIYEETIFVEHYSSAFRGTQSNSALTWMLTGLEHLGRNHSYFVQPALDWASDEDSWTE